MSRKKPEKKAISQEWLTTYSDMVTLLLTFFVLLYSFSLVDVRKFAAAAASMADAFNVGSTKSSNEIFDFDQSSGSKPIVGEDKESDDNQDNSNNEASNTKENILSNIKAFVAKNNLSDKVTIKEGSRGIYIEFKDKILFDTGKAVIKEDGIPAIMQISEFMRNLPNHIVIEGHTDNIPISTEQFPSNWELSEARAMSVMKYLINNRGLEPSRFSTAAYGEYSPVDTNDTPEGRAQNRRVNILILTDIEELEELK